MASHVPFLAVRPDEQFSSDIKTRDSANTITNGIMANAAPRRAVSAKDDMPWRFPVAVIVAFSLSALFYTLSAGFTGAELAAVSSSIKGPGHIAAITAWKLAELSIAWYACYDYLDLAYLTLLTQVPHYFLLNTFYGVDYFASLIPLLIDVASISIPFYFLRRLNSGHQNTASKTENQYVAQDNTVRAATALFGATIYGIVVYGSFQTWLPVYMVTYFDGVRSLEKVHSTVLPLLLGLFAPIGYAATQFVFVPAIGSHGNPGITDPRLAPVKTRFNAETASFAETVAYNLGLSQAGFTPRAEILLKRTAILAAYTLINTFVRSYLTLAGSEFMGALGWASVWTAAAGLTGLAFAWVGNE